MNISRYERNNVCALDSVKAYSKKIPGFLHNRPGTFVQHCLKRLPPKACICNEEIQHINGTTFHITAQSTGQKYTVELSSVTGMPYCSCKDWATHHLPCKHLLALLNLNIATWDELPKHYINSPAFVLDVPVHVNESQIFKPPLIQTTDTNDDNDVLHETGPSAHDTNSNSREILCQIRSMTYNITEDE